MMALIETPHVPGAAWPDFRCNHCHGKRRYKVRVRRRDRDVYAEVKAYVLTLIADPFERSFTKEPLAVKLQVKNHNVEQALVRLNREGLVSRAMHRYPHDNNRNPYDGARDSSWAGDRYSVRRPDDPKDVW